MVNCLHSVDSLRVNGREQIFCRECHNDYQKIYRSSKNNQKNKPPGEMTDFTDFLPDVGCEESPTCLSCPLLMCRYDNQAWYREFKKKRSFSGVLERTDGQNLRQAGDQEGLSTQTIRRLRKKAKVSI